MKSRSSIAKTHQPRNDNVHRWLVSYADIVTLLLCLFIVLYAISAPNEGQFKEVSSSLSNAFKQKVESLEENINFSGQLEFLMEDNAIEGYQEIFKQWESQISEEDTFSSIASDIKNLIVEQYDNSQVKVDITDEWIEVSLNSDVVFSPGSAYVNYRARESIEKMSKLFKDREFNIHVEGHTDDSLISNILYPTNWELSSARATAVLRVLLDSGIETDRLIATGYGSQYPIASNETLLGRFTNRRVVFVIPKIDSRLNYLKQQKENIK